MALVAGLVSEVAVTVTPQDTAAALGSSGLAVLATPRMVALMEQAAFQSVQPHLAEGETTVGISLEIQHTAATPVGMPVTARARLVQVDGRRLVFDVEAADGQGQIGSGRHERFVVKTERFQAKADARRNRNL